MEAEKKGVQNLKEVIDLALDCVDLGKGVLADGTINMADLAVAFGHLPKIVSDLGPAIQDIDQIVPEVMDLDGEEGIALVAHVVGRIGGTTEQAKAIIEASVGMVVASVKLVKAIVVAKAA